MQCINKNSPLITGLSDKLGLKPIIISAQLGSWSKANNVSLEDENIEQKFIEYLSSSDKHTHLNIRKLNTSNKSDASFHNIEELENFVNNAKLSEDTFYLNADSIKNIIGNNIMNTVNNSVGIPNNIILPYNLEPRSLVLGSFEVMTKSKNSFYKDFSPEERKRRVDLIANLFSNRINQLSDINPDKSRIDIIKEYGTSEIMNDIKNEFQRVLTGDNTEEIKNKIQKIVDNFQQLSKLASPKIGYNENIKISNVTTGEHYNKYENSDDLDNEDDLFKEEKEKDRWMTEYMETSNLASLSTVTRKVLSKIPMLDSTGNIDYDDLGFTKFLDADYVHAELIDGLKNMTSGTDLIPMLTNMSISKPWIKGIINILDSSKGSTKEEIKEIQRTKALFYKDFRKDAAKFYIQKKQIAPDGTVTIKNISLNSPKGVLFLINKLRDVLNTDTLLTKSAIYNKDGSFNRENIEENLKINSSLLKELNTIKINNPIQEDKDIKITDFIDVNINTLTDLFRSVGFQVNNDEVSSILKYKPALNISSICEEVLNSIQSIFSIAKNTKENLISDKLHYFNSQYKNISNLIAPFVEEYYESSVHQGSKMLYSHLVPNYFGKITKLLKNVKNDTIDNYRDWVSNEFGKAQFFYKNNEYRNEWLRLLTLQDSKGNDLGSKYRNMFDESILLSSNNIDYTELDSVGYASALVHEYFSDPNKEFAKYHVPIMADAPIARFIKFIRYTNGSENDENFIPLDYEDIIIDKLVQVAHQELDRIAIVKTRNLNPDILKIKNFDKNGEKFCFLTFLNKNLQDIQNMQAQNKSEAEINLMLKSLIENGLNTEFESTMRDWYEKGLFNVDEKGVLKHFDIKTLGIDQKNIDKIFNLDYTKDENGRRFNNDNPLKNYFFNTFFAESQIIQILTNDIAQYKDTIDFQKRSKEWNAPGLKLDTSIEGGRQFEHTIYLKDNEVFSDVDTLNNLKESINNGVKKGRLSNFERDYILSKFGAFNAKIFTYNDDKYKHTISNDGVSKGYSKNGNKISKEEYEEALINSHKEENYVLYRDNKGYIPTSTINMTDAQAYRSLNSYKSILLMAGKLTPDISNAMDRMQKGNWDIKDFNIVLNAFKPFLFTNTIINSNLTDSNGNPIYMRQANQNKNSEFMLLLYSVIANSPKLTALSDFMSKEYTFGDGSKGYIDVVQFNSAVKAGEQGVLDINNLDNKEDILSYLESNVSNPDIVHTFNYDDYSLQQEIPDHYKDTTQLFGTQIRKLIHADLDPNIKLSLNINGKDLKLSKSEFLDWYNHAITENLISDFESTVKVLGNKYELEKLLKEEITSKNTYNQDLVDAVSLNSNGEFNIPLFEPSQSIKIQNLLNSIIKNRITKQKIKGGSLVQVTSYGLSDDLHIIYEGEGNNKHIKYYECYMPWYSKQYVEQLMGENGELDINKLPEDLKKLIGYRIPTEDSYSMMPLYIKGFLPQNSGSAIMLPAEITTIAGCDFDVDKLYFMAPEFNIKGNKISKINVDVDTPEGLKNCSREQRNNLLIDMIYSVLTHPDTVTKSMNPGGFDKWIDAMNKYKSTKSEFNPLNPGTQVALHQQNMGAKKLIGIFANHNVNHALLQNTEASINPEYAFTYNGKSFTKLNQIQAAGGHYISRTLAGLVASSVDAIKQPVLGTLNINTFTADTVCLLARLGYNEEECSALLVHPIIKELSNRFKQLQSTFPSKDSIIRDLKEDLLKINPISIDTNNDIKENKFLVSDIDKDIKENISFTDIKDNPDVYKDVADKYYKILDLYSKISEIAEDLNTVVSILKSDTSNGAAGPTIADNINKLDKLIDFAMYKQSPDSKVLGLDSFVNSVLDIYNKDYTDTDIFNSEKMRDIIYKNTLAYPLAFNIYGLQSTIPLLSKYFPHYTDNFRNLIRNFKEISSNGKLSVKTMNSIYNAYFSYITSSIDSFGGNQQNISDRINYYIKDFPEEFKKILESKKYNNNAFISKLNVANIKDTNLKKIYFNNVGKLSPTTKESVIDGWNALLYGDETDKKLANDLFYYNYYRKGFEFAPESFIHLAPTELKMQIPKYVDTMNSLLRNANYDTNYFQLQYILNNLDNRKFTPILDINLKSQDIKNGLQFTNNFKYDPVVSKLSKIHGDEVIWNNTFGVKIANDIHYFLLYDLKENTAYYKEVKPLGLKNEFQEYSYETPIDSMSRVLYDSVVKDSNNTNEDIEDTIEDYASEDLDYYDSRNNTSFNNNITEDKEDFLSTKSEAINPDSGNKYC